MQVDLMIYYILCSAVDRRLLSLIRDSDKKKTILISEFMIDIDLCFYEQSSSLSSCLSHRFFLIFRLFILNAILFD